LEAFCLLPVAAQLQVVKRLVEERTAGYAQLTYSQFSTLIDLIVARGTSPSGFVTAASLEVLEISPVTISRLRNALDQAIGSGTGRELVETGCAEEYRLAIPADALRTQVVVEAGFFELELIGLITPQQAAALRRICTVEKSR